MLRARSRKSAGTTGADLNTGVGCSGGGVGVNYRWHGDGVDFNNREVGEGFKTLRVWNHNLDGSGGVLGLANKIQLWQKYEVDVVLVQDVRLTKERLAVVLDRIKSDWGGVEMKWVYEEVAEKVSHPHGVLVLVRSKWARFVHSMIRDVRGWGRYAGVILVGHGDGGKRRQLALLSCYAQGKGSARWKWEEEQMESWECGGCHSDEQYRKDVGDEIGKLHAQKVCVVLGGDFNFAWHQAYSNVSSGGKYAEAWRQWAKVSCGMVNAASVALKGPVPTFVRCNAEDDKG